MIKSKSYTLRGLDKTLLVAFNVESTVPEGAVDEQIEKFHVEKVL